MSEILGRDCDGKPLRAGDRVVFVGPRGTVEPGIGDRAEGIHVVTGPVDGIPFTGLLGSRFLALQGDLWAECLSLKRIDDDNENDDTASWEAIKKLTGWQPRKEPVGAA